VSLTDFPRVIEGEGFGIVENVGGVGGLTELANVLKKGKGQEYKEYCEWLGTKKLDLTKFDMDDMNYRIKKLVRVYKKIYEDHEGPSAKTISILLRQDQGKGPMGY
jgi:hypothetical protein